MVIEDGMPAHWPKMVERGHNDNDEQSAVKTLARIRQMVVNYLQETDDDWRVHVAKTDHLINVVAGVLADAKINHGLALRAFSRENEMHQKVLKLLDDLKEAKRPFTAQMEMQNRRIIDLTRQLDEANSKLGKTGE